MADLDVTPEDYEKARAGCWWDIEKLREYITINAPATLQKDFAGKELPFPSDLVAGITEDQVSSLQSVFEVPDADRYGCWCTTYLGANRRFLEHGQRGTDIVRKLRNAVTAVYLPEVFFLLAFSYLLNNKKETQFKERDSGLWAQLNNRAQTHAKALEKVINQLVHIVELADEGDAKGRSKLMLPEVAKWFRKHGFKDLLTELLEVTEKDRQESQRIFEKLYAPLKENFPSNKVETNPGVIYRAFDEVARIMGEVKGKKTRDVKGAQGLFSRWDIAIDEVAEKVSRRRRKRGT
jgi:hypothetical protein